MHSDLSTLMLLEDQYTWTRSCLNDAIDAAESLSKDEEAVHFVIDSTSLRVVEAALEYYLLGLAEIVFQAIALIVAEDDIHRFSRREAINNLPRSWRYALRSLDKRRKTLLHLKMYPVEEACILESVSEALDRHLPTLQEAVPDLLNRAPTGESLEDLEVLYLNWSERLDHATITLRESGAVSAIHEVEGALKYCTVRFFEVLFKTAELLPENQESRYWSGPRSRFDIIEGLRDQGRITRANARDLQELLVERNIIVHFRAGWKEPYRYHGLEETLDLILEYFPIVDDVVRGLQEEVGMPRS